MTKKCQLYEKNRHARLDYRTIVVSKALYSSDKNVIAGHCMDKDIELF